MARMEERDRVGDMVVVLWHSEERGRTKGGWKWDMRELPVQLH